MEAGFAIALIIALGAGLACGWIAWGRVASGLRAERDDWREKFTRAIADLHVALADAGQVAPLREELAENRRQQDVIRREAAENASGLRALNDDARREAAEAVAAARGLSADRDARAEAAEAQQRQLTEARDALTETRALLDAARRETAEVAAEARGLRADREARDEAAAEQSLQLVDARDALTQTRSLLDVARRETAEVSAEVRGLRADREARDEAAAAQLRQLVEAKEALSAQFGEVGARLLDTAQRQFLERADQRFHQAGAEGEAKIKAALAPVEATLKRYEEGVAKVEEERRREQGNLTGLIESMRTGQEAVRGEAARLVNALRAAPKARGRWGEQQLRNVLESCGLSEHADFQTEVSVDIGEDGRMRPDVIIRVPGGSSLVIDAKVSLNAYQDAFEAVDEAERARHLAAHALAMRAHVNGLGNKAYWDKFAKSADYVIMFVPGEHFLSAALEQDARLWDFAFAQRVLLATPTNLIAIARTVAAVWRQEGLAREAKAIGALGKEMHDRLATASGLLKLVGKGLNTAVDNYNKFTSSFESRVAVTGRKFRDMNIEVGSKLIEEVPQIELRARRGEDVAEDRAAAE